jgi:hypothetical protein
LIVSLPGVTAPVCAGIFPAHSGTIDNFAIGLLSMKRGFRIVQMRIRSFRLILALALFGGFAEMITTADASTVTYHFDNVGFDGGGTITGTFQFDTSSSPSTPSLLRNVSLASTSFLQASNPSFSTTGAPIRAATFTDGAYFPCAFVGCALYQGGLGAFLFYNNSDIFTPNHDYVTLDILIPQADVPPTNSFNLNMYTFGLGYNAQPIGFAMWDQVTSGSVSTTPLPPSWTMMLIGLAGFGFVAYRRKSKPALVTA